MSSDIKLKLSFKEFVKDAGMASLFRSMSSDQTITTDSKPFDQYLVIFIRSGLPQSWKIQESPDFSVGTLSLSLTKSSLQETKRRERIIHEEIILFLQLF
jgi:hypothetical protein